MGIRCPKCNTDNPDTQKFCGECAAPLPSSKEIPVTETLETPKEELTTGSTFAGRYQIIEVLGKGGMGKVYRALDKKLNEEVALKLVKPEIASDKKTLERFSNELKIARKIAHKNVGRMYELMEEKGTHFITMEYVPGEDLKSFIKRAGPLSAGKTAFIAKQVCEGLAEAHQLGVVHRDLKPQNIMIDKEGNSRIMDFGIARSLKAKGITAEGMIIGTPEYMSPEQVEAKEADQRSDIYSLGIILYEMVTGKVPFEGDTPLSIAVKHKTEMAANPKELNAQIPEDLGRLILRCMEKDKEKRYQRPEEILSELKKIDKGIPTTEIITPKKKPLTLKEITRTIKKRWVLISMLFIVMIGIGLALLYFKIGKPALSPAINKLVVLPFENLGSPEDEYFADGITDEITARLNHISQLEVIARTSAMQYKKTEKSIQRIGEELGVRYVLTGTVRWQRLKDGESRVRITPTLVKASDATQVWADLYEEMFADVFHIQSEIAKKVAGALNITLLEPERQVLDAIPTNNSEAYKYYLRGNQYFYKGRIEKQPLISSIEMFEQAIKLDPNFVQAYLKLSIAHSSAYWEHFDHTEARVLKAKKALDRAMQLAPDLPETYWALGVYYYHCKMEYENALLQFKIALEKQPKNSEILAYIGYVHRRKGNFSQTISYLEKALEIDPRSSLTAYNIGVTYSLIRNYKEAEHFFKKAISLSPDFVHPYSEKTLLYLKWEGDTKKARAVLEEASRNFTSLDEHLIVYPWILIEILDGEYQEALNRLSLVQSEAFQYETFFVPKAQLYAQIYSLMGNTQRKQEYYNLDRIYLENKIREQPNDSRLYSALGIAYAGLGLKEKAIQEAKKAVELMPISKEAIKGVYRARDLAQVFVMVGEYENAIDQIEYLLSIPGNISVPLLRIAPTWTSLKEQPRFKKLIE
ncbi:MAG: protein kinase [Candidatus Hydrothermarchaeota archaeon]